MPSGQLRDELKEEAMGSGADSTKKELNEVLPKTTDEMLDYYVKEPEGDVVASRGDFVVGEPDFESANKIDVVEEGSPLDIQIGGNHYKDFKIQPIEYITANELSFPQGDIVKRITRYKMPTGKGLEDLIKCKHVIDLIIELEGWGDAITK